MSLQEWNTVLVCPRCKGSLVAQEEIPAFDCTSCKLRFPVEEEVPIMILERAVPIS